MGRRRPQLARKNGLLGLGSCPGSKHGDRGATLSKQISTLPAAGQDRAGSHEGSVLIDKKTFVPHRAVLELGAGQQAPPRLHPAAGGDTERVRGAAECGGSAACDGRLQNGEHQY